MRKIIVSFLVVVFFGVIAAMFDNVLNIKEPVVYYLLGIVCGTFMTLIAGEK